MTSKILPSKLLRQQSMNKKWLLVLSSITQFLLGPTAFLFLSDLRLSYHMYINESILETKATILSSILQTSFIPLQMVIAAVGAFLVAIFGFDYLFSKRTVDLQHSAPIKRGTLFKVRFFNGVLFWLIPTIISQVTIFIILFTKIGASSYLPQFFTIAIKMFAYSLLTFFSVYTVVLVAVILSGNVINAIINSITLGCGFILSYFIFYLCATTYFSTFVSPVIELKKVIWLSPIAAPFYYFIASLDVSNLNFDSSTIFSIILSIVLACVNFIVAYKLYNVRKSELSEHGTNNKPYTIISRLLVSLVGGIFGSLFFSSFSSNYSKVGWGIFGSIVVTIFSFCILNIIYENNFKALFKNKLQLIVINVVSIVIFLIMFFDLFGYDSYLPNKAFVNNIYIQSAFALTDEGARVDLKNNQNWGTIPSMEIENLDEGYALLEKSSKALNGSASFILKVTTKLGFTYSRKYFFNNDNYEEFSDIMNNPTYKEIYYPASTGELRLPDRISISSTSNGSYTIYDKPTIEALMKNYKDDFEANYSIDKLTNYFSQAYIYLEYDTEQGMPHSSIDINLDIPNFYNRTISYITENTGIKFYSKNNLDFSQIEFTPDILPEVIEKLSATDLSTNENILIGSPSNETYYFNESPTQYDYIGGISVDDSWIDVYLNVTGFFGENINIFKPYNFIDGTAEFYSY